MITLEELPLILEEYHHKLTVLHKVIKKCTNTEYHIALVIYTQQSFDKKIIEISSINNEIFYTNNEPKKTDDNTYYIFETSRRILTKKELHKRITSCKKWFSEHVMVKDMSQIKYLTMPEFS